MKQNVILFTADQFRYDCLGHLGVFPVKTPNLDALAAGGTIFDNAYTPYPMCVPARASIMTGLPACRHGVYYNSMSWPKNMETLPGVLAENGYYTVKVGKTHFFPPERHGGFHKVMTPEELRRFMSDKNQDFGKKKMPEPGATGRDWDNMVVRHYNHVWDAKTKLEDYPPVMYTTYALAELDRIAATRACRDSASEPFFMWISVLQPHSPCKPPPPYNDMYRPEDLPPPVKSEAELKFFAKPLLEGKRGWRALDDTSIAAFRARYMGDVSAVDAQVGRVIEKLEQLGLRENTLFIFTSDHGDYLGDHHLLQKGYFHEPSSRVPLIFNGPGVKKGHRVSGLASLCDIKPTVLERCSLSMPGLRDHNGVLIEPDWAPAPDTMSLEPALQGQDLPADRVMLSESGIYGHGLMARQANLKYNYYPQTQEFDFFDLESDPKELNNRGCDVTWETLPDWARKTFERILADCEHLRGRSYEYDGIVRPMFT